MQGDFTVDPWGLDADLVGLAAPVAALRWRVDTEGAERLPRHGAALLVVNRRFGLSEPFVVARALRLATGRALRVVGVPDIAPVGPVLRRLGGALARPDEVAGLLRAGEVVALSLGRALRSGHAGHVDPALVAPAADLDVAVVPVATAGRELCRRWTVRVGAPLDPSTPRPADAASRAVEALLRGG